MPFVIKSLNASVVCCYCVENTKIPRPLMNRAPLSLLVICFEIWMRSWRGDEGYKDGCWTPIREGLSLVSRQTRGGTGGGDQINTPVNIQGGETPGVAVTAHLCDASLLSWEYLESLGTGMPWLCPVSALWQTWWEPGGTFRDPKLGTFRPFWADLIEVLTSRTLCLTYFRSGKTPGVISNGRERTYGPCLLGVSLCNVCYHEGRNSPLRNVMG